MVYWEAGEGEGGIICIQAHKCLILGGWVAG